MFESSRSIYESRPGTAYPPYGTEAYPSPAAFSPVHLAAERSIVVELPASPSEAYELPDTPSTGTKKEVVVQEQVSPIEMETPVVKKAEAVLVVTGQPKATQGKTDGTT